VIAGQGGGMRPSSVAAALIVALLAAVARPAAAEDVAVTFDDLPSLTYSTSTDYQAQTTERLLAGLKRQRIPAIGFVNEIKLATADRERRIALLARWLDAGFELGDHSYSHAHFSATPLTAYIGDVSRGDTVTRGLLAQRRRPPPQWYRHPYLETGPTPADRQGFEAWMAAHGYRAAPVSMENSDWRFALVYDDAVMRGDAAAQAHIREAYLAFTRQITPWYRQAALEVLGRRPAFVLLLHATRLNADCLDELAAIFRANQLRPVTLAQAMKDPAYAIADAYAGPDGLGWVTRWSLALKKPMPWKDLPKPPADIIAADDRLAAGPAKAQVPPPTPPKTEDAPTRGERQRS
jgi:peptidoglycan/xylan/chitin deacetylase (PgdA/CDA1 family)